jgi:hypothetical protein
LTLVGAEHRAAHFIQLLESRRQIAVSHATVGKQWSSSSVLRIRSKRALTRSKSTGGSFLRFEEDVLGHHELADVVQQRRERISRSCGGEK